MTIEVRPEVNVGHWQSDTEGQVLGCVIRVSRKSAGSLKIYLENREKIRLRCGEKEGEIEIAKSLLGQIDRSLGRRRNNKTDEAVLALNVLDVGQFGNLLEKQGVRLPPLMSAMVEITGKMEAAGREELLATGKYCMNVLNQIESMPH